jgi:L-asparaginase
MDAILVVTTGGTIDKVYFDAKSEFEVGRSLVGELLREAHVHAAYDVVEVLRKDSLDLTDADRQAIRDVVAAATIVLTGALAPARFANTDAAFNVGMAFAAVQTLPPGVYIAMNGQVFDGAKVRKDSAANRFIAT